MPTVTETPFLLTACEAADLLRLSTRTIRRWIAEERLRAVRTHPGNGGRLLLRRNDVLAAVGIVEPPPPPAPAAPRRGRRKVPTAATESIQ